MAKIDRRCRAPPENMLAIPRMPLELSWKKRATASGLMPGTGMKVPMRYTTMPAIRNARRPRISLKRDTSPSAAVGLLDELLATFADLSGMRNLLDLAARGGDRRQGTLGRSDALEGHGAGNGAREHHFGHLGMH